MLILGAHDKKEMFDKPFVIASRFAQSRMVSQVQFLEASSKNISDVDDKLSADSDNLFAVEDNPSAVSFRICRFVYSISKTICRFN